MTGCNAAPLAGKFSTLMTTQRKTMSYLFDRPCYKCKATTCDGTCEDKMIERIMTDANGRKYITTEPLRRQAAGLTREQARAIMRMARELEDTGRLCSLSRGSDYAGQDSGAARRKNREVQCALQDYLDALVSG
jgi:hypothetical protein